MHKSELKYGVTVAVEAPMGAPFPIVYPDIYHTVSWLAENGFQSIELHLRTPELVDGPRLRAYCDEHGIAVCSIGTGQAAGAEGLLLCANDEEIRSRAMARLMAQIDLAKITGGVVIIGSMRGTVGEGDYDQHDRRFVSQMRELADYAGERGVALAIEAIDRYETDYLKTAAEVLGAIEKIARENVLLHLDTFHMNMEEADMAAPVMLAGRKLGHVHAADNNRNYPGWGHIKFDKFLKALQKISYEGSIVIESFPVPDGYTAALEGLWHLQKCCEI